MRRAVFAVLLCACTESANPTRSCESEHADVDKANAAFRRATEWYTRAHEQDPHSGETDGAWVAVNAAASHQTRARKALAACLSREE